MPACPPPACTGAQGMCGESCGSFCVILRVVPSDVMLPRKRHLGEIPNSTTSLGYFCNATVFLLLKPTVDRTDLATERYSSIILGRTEQMYSSRTFRAGHVNKHHQKHLCSQRRETLTPYTGRGWLAKGKKKRKEKYSGVIDNIR